MAILTLRGKPVDWNDPPKPSDMVIWAHQGKQYRASLRTVCHLDRLNELAKRRFGKEIVVLQGPWNTGVAASAGTHDYDSVWDIYIPGVDWWVQQRFFRRHGFACWFRHPPKFGYHIHGFTLPIPEGHVRSDDWKLSGFEVGIYVDGGYSTRGRLVTSSQIADYYNEAFGLADEHTPASDRSWFPDDKDATIFDLNRFIKHRAKLQNAA